jgi:uncharacterized small protein (DUF1192 family)
MSTQDWDDVLQRVERCLAEALHDADERARDFDDCQKTTENAQVLRPALEATPVAGLRERLAALESGMAAAEAELSATEEALRVVLEQAVAARSRLAEWATCAIR